VLAWLTDLRSIRDEELGPILDTAVNREDRLRWEAVRTLSPEPFARALNDRGLLPVVAQVIAGRRTEQATRPGRSLAELNPSDCAYVLSRHPGYLPEEASAACLPLGRAPTPPPPPAGFPRSTDGLPRRPGRCGDDRCAVPHSHPDPQPPRAGNKTGSRLPAAFMAPLSEQDAATLEGRDPRPVRHRRHTRHAYLTERVPALAVQAITAWLTAGAALADARGELFAFAAGPLPSQPSGLQIFEACATSAPVEFAQAVGPIPRRATGAFRLPPASDGVRPASQGIPARAFGTTSFAPFGNQGRGLEDEIHDGATDGVCSWPRQSIPSRPSRRSTG